MYCDMNYESIDSASCILYDKELLMNLIVLC